jgi:hypothetical protein
VFSGDGMKVLPDRSDYFIMATFSLNLPLSVVMTRMYIPFDWVGLVMAKGGDDTGKPQPSLAVTITFPAEVASGVTVTVRGREVSPLAVVTQRPEGKVQI